MDIDSGLIWCLNGRIDFLGFCSFVFFCSEKFLKLEEEKKKKREPKKADKGPQIRFKSYLSYDGATGDEIDNELSREADLTQGTRFVI